MTETQLLEEVVEDDEIEMIDEEEDSRGRGHDLVTEETTRIAGDEETSLLLIRHRPNQII